MSRSIDFIPSAYRARLRRGKTRRYMIIALTAIGLSIGLGGWSLRAAVMHRHRELRDLTQLVTRTQAHAHYSANLQKQIDEAQELLADQNKLVYPMKMSGVMATFCRMMPGPVTLDSLEMRSATRHLRSTGETRRKPSSKAKKDEKDTTRKVMICEATGVARTDIDVADFVGRLTEHPLFEEVALDFSRPTQVGEVDARSFRVSCQIDLEVTYEIEDLKDPLAATAEPVELAQTEANDEP